MSTRIISSQWVKTRSGLPSKATAILYLEYSFEPPSSIVRYGHYDWQRRQFIEQGSGEETPKDLVIAWMSVPELPAEIREEHRPAELPGVYNEEHPCLD